MSIYRASVRASKQLSTRWVRACSGEVAVEISDIEKAAGHGRTKPWHYTVPHDFKDTRSDLHKAQHRGETPDYDKKKGALRVEGRLNGIEVPKFCYISEMENREALEAKVDALKDEDGIFHAPHVKEMPSMTFNGIPKFRFSGKTKTPKRQQNKLRLMAAEKTTCGSSGEQPKLNSKSVDVVCTLLQGQR